ncbi:hypothetical protein HDU67_002348 [Dinochytrium kinnereticum]|nr:hypothetical protein HDU67_002348 [Dinochytrium kinnereticum]
MPSVIPSRRTASDLTMLALGLRAVLRIAVSQASSDLSLHARTSTLPKLLTQVSSTLQQQITSVAASSVASASTAVRSSDLGEVDHHEMSLREFRREKEEIQRLAREQLVQPVVVKEEVAPSLKEEIPPVDAYERHISDAGVLQVEEPAKVMQASKVPSSRIGRLFQYGGLAMGVGVGAAAEALRRATGVSSGSDNGGSLLLTKSNIQRIVDRLSRMRGAALKLGQMLSIQDSSMMPPEFEQILLRVQNSANYMPDSQLEQVMRRELGADWKHLFVSFDPMPIAAASIGQVHKAVLRCPSSGDHRSVAVKVQYPGVAKSIDSDLDYLRALATMGSILPKGMYLDNTIRVARLELGWECDYVREAESIVRFRELVEKSGLTGFNVPKVFGEVSTGSVLVTDFVEGVSIGKVGHLSQERRNEIGEKLLRLCLRELFDFKFMQTDPNWSNFLYNEQHRMIHLLDFGASREFDKTFTDAYLQVLVAASEGDREGCVFWSRKLGFLTGLESETMISAHVNSLLALAEPFSLTHRKRPFNFHNQSITNRVRSEIPVMLRERLTPPPDETYSLHRKLSGCFLLCAKVGAVVDCRGVFEEVLGSYRW